MIDGQISLNWFIIRPRRGMTMWIQNNVSGTKDARRVKITSGVEYAKLWLSGASVEDLVRVSRLL